MKKLFSVVLFVGMMQIVFAQYDQNREMPADTEKNRSDQVNPNRPDVNPNIQNQTMNQQNVSWDLYDGRKVESSTVPQSTTKSFTVKYPNQNDVVWYSYSRGYIATYPGTDKMYQGVIYDKDGKMVGTVNRVRYSTLSSSVTGNMKRKYPNMSSEYVYEVTSPTGKKTYVSSVNGNWSDFNDAGSYIEKR